VQRPAGFLQIYLRDSVHALNDSGWDQRGGEAFGGFPVNRSGKLWGNFAGRGLPSAWVRKPAKTSIMRAQTFFSSADSESHRWMGSFLSASPFTFISFKNEDTKINLSPDFNVSSTTKTRQEIAVVVDMIHRINGLARRRLKRLNDLINWSANPEPASVYSKSICD
jgi:hypothetical protein